MSKPAPLVSILVASYNNALYIEQTLISIELQDYKDIEIIIVDDCSKDNSVAIIEKWIVSTQSSYVFVKNETNLGVCKTMNIALSKAKGKYISIIGSDDLMLKNKVSSQVPILENSVDSVGFVYSDAFLIGPKGERYFGRFIQWHKHFFEIPQTLLFENLLKANFIPVMSVLWKAECFEVCGKFDEELLYEDYDMLLRVSSVYTALFSDEVSVEYRVHLTNAHNKLQSLAAVETNFRIFYKLIGVQGGKYNSLIRSSLDYYLFKLYELKSKKMREYFNQYKLHFKADKILEFALSTGLPYYKISKLNRIFSRVFTK